eukprot:jgi/Botrbrau1/577/Bobra.0010s0043.1
MGVDENPPPLEENEDEIDQDEAESYKRYSFMPRRPLAQPAVQEPLPAAASQPARTPSKPEAASEEGVGSDREGFEEGDSLSDEQPRSFIPIWVVSSTASSLPSQGARGLKPVAPAGAASQPAHTPIKQGHVLGPMPSPLEPGTSGVPQAGARDHLSIPTPVKVEAPVWSQAEKSGSENPDAAPGDRSGDRQPSKQHPCPCLKGSLAAIQSAAQAKRKRDSRLVNELPEGYELRPVLAPDMHTKLCNGCGKSKWERGVDQYIINGDDPCGTEKFCVDCACMWLDFLQGVQPERAAGDAPSIVERRLKLQAHLPHPWMVKVVSYESSRPCSRCGTCRWRPLQDTYVYNCKDIMADKFCLDCGEAWCTEMELEDPAESPQTPEGPCAAVGPDLGPALPPTPAEEPELKRMREA